MANYDSKTDYQALINQAVSAGDYGQAAIYEQQRNSKIGDMNAAGTNTNNYQMTNLYSGYLNGGSGGSITPAQQMAQALSPATASQRQTVLDNMAGSMMSGSTPAYQAPDTSAYDAQLSQALSALQNTEYVAPSWNDYYNERSLDDYVAEAIRMMEPQYASQFDEARNRAAQNLDRAGLYNSLYGQGLAQNAENAVTRAMLSDASNMAQQQKQQDYENAMALYKTAIDNAQFGYSSQADRLKTVVNSAHSSISEALQRSAQLNNYNLEASAQAIQRQAAAADMLYQSEQITAMQYENMLTQAQIQAENINSQLKQAQLNEMVGIQTGGWYQADANGKAPKGLTAGDYVETKGGIYQVTGVAADGSYTSKKMPDGFSKASLMGYTDTGYSGGSVYSPKVVDDGPAPIVDKTPDSGSSWQTVAAIARDAKRSGTTSAAEAAAQAGVKAYNSGSINDQQAQYLVNALNKIGK